MERGNHFHRRPHSGQSITHQTAPILHTREYFQKKESAALGQIPGVKELLNAYDDCPLPIGISRREFAVFGEDITISVFDGVTSER